MPTSVTRNTCPANFLQIRRPRRTGSGGAVTEAKWKAQSLCRHVKLAGADSFQNGAEDAEDIVN